MSILNLKDELLSAISYKVIKMPDGQPHIQIEDGYGCDEVICSLASMDDFGKLLVALDALHRMAGGVNDNWRLTIHYMLGARQDNPQLGEPMTVGIFAQILDQYEYGSINILHPHSIVTQTVFGQRFEEMDHTKYVELAIADYNPDFLIIPDLGAAKNAKNYDKFGLPQVQCTKNRDPSTGKLSGFSILGDVPEGKKGLVVDDVCCGGGTFIGISKLFRSELALYTTHGVYSKGLEGLEEVFANIYTTDSYPSNVTSEKLTVFNI